MLEEGVDGGLAKIENHFSLKEGEKISLKFFERGRGENDHGEGRNHHLSPAAASDRDKMILLPPPPGDRDPLRGPSPGGFRPRRARPAKP